jgi:UDP-N-acetylmuramate dehydrogenase
VLVTSVLYKLDKTHKFNLKYGSLKDEAEKMGELSIRTLRQAIVHIRQSKLPDPITTGNAGSFFMNPVVSATLAHNLLQTYPQMPIYQTDDELKVKLAAGWLIEKAGWKGYREGDAGVHADQALVLVNHGQASGADIIRLARKIQDSVFETFGVELRPEVNVLA